MTMWQLLLAVLLSCQLILAPRTCLATEFTPGQVIVRFTPASAPTAGQVTSPPPAFGISSIDNILTSHGVYAIEKYIPSYSGEGLAAAIATGDQTAIDAAGRLERTYIVYYSAVTEPSVVSSELAALSSVEMAKGNKLLEQLYGGTVQTFPSDLIQAGANQQWSFHYDLTDDRADIDAPEAWSIERGDTNTVIIVIDSGTLVDISTTPWTLHGELRYRWNDAEDVGIPKRTLSFVDLNGSDAGTDADSYADNIIGYNYDGEGPGIPKPALWTSVPHNYLLILRNEELWDIGGYKTHGLNAAGIALAKANDQHVVGLAHECSGYIIRRGFDVLTESDAVKHAYTVHPRSIINMSIGVDKLNDPGSPYSDEIIMAARVYNCVLVACAGNEHAACPGGSTEPVWYPARYADVLSVGSIGKNLQKDCYANFGPAVGHVDVVAPVGSGIPTVSHTTNCAPPCQVTETVMLFDGTSAASPEVAGLAALVRTRFPGMGQATIRSRIKDTAEYYWTQSVDDQKKYGSGKVNAYRALSEWGTITGNVTWVQNTSPTGVATGSRDGKYYVSGDLTIEPGATLTIDAGVIVNVAPDHEQLGSDPGRVKITVMSGGALNILGMPGDEVRFESFKDGAVAADDWIGIVFEPGSRGILKNVIIQNAITDVVVDEFGVSVSDWDATKTLYLNSDFNVSSDLTIADNHSLYVLGNSDVVVTAGAVDITVDGSLIVKGSATQKPEFRSSTGAPSSWGVLTLTTASENNVFLNAVVRHASALRSDVPITVDGCLFSEGTLGLQPYANLTVLNSLFYDLSSDAVDVNGGTASFTKCTFADNGGAAIAIRGGSSTVDKCVIAFNGGPAARVISGTPTMSNSVVYQNTFAAGSPSDADWQSQGQVVYNLNPAFCDAANGDYEVFAFSPASAPTPPYTGYFGERVGARDIGCIPPAVVTATSSQPGFAGKPWIVVTCPKGDADTLEVVVDLNGPITRNIDRLEVVLDAADCADGVGVFDQDAFVEAQGDAVGPSFIATFGHMYFGGHGVNDVDVLLNGQALESQAHFEIRSPDITGDGIVNLVDLPQFHNHYQSPPKPYDSKCDFESPENEIQLQDFATFGAHYNHVKPAGYQQLNSQVAESNAGLDLAFTEEFPTANTHRLYVDVRAENFAGVSASAFSMRSGSERLAFVEWIPAQQELGAVLFSPVLRDGVEESFFGVLVSESFAEAGATLGRLVFDVSGVDPMEISDDNFALTVGDVLLETAGAGPVVATMGGAFNRTFDPAVARIYHNSLAQNFPNPFNPTTTLAFSIKDAGNVSLTIYDVAGRRVRELVNEPRERGAYKVVWDGRNDTGTTVSSGVYFYKLVAGSFTDTKKMTILK